MRPIDADAAIEAINKREKLMVGDKCVGVDHIRTFINNRPTIDCEPVRHGEWGFYRDNIAVCPFCGGNVSPDWVVCPHCSSVERITLIEPPKEEEG